MNSFERRREQKKETVRQADTYLFLESSLEKLAMRQIVDRANVSHVIVFRHFTSKQVPVQRMDVEGI